MYAITWAKNSTEEIPHSAQQVKTKERYMQMTVIHFVHELLIGLLVEAG
jgi:hypothetical protein